MLLIDQLREAATRCMAQAGCDNDCRDGERVAFAAWLRITGRISDFLPGDGRPLFSIDSVLGDGSSAKLCELTRDSPS